MSATKLEEKLETLRNISQLIHSLSESKDRDDVTTYGAQKQIEELGKCAIKIVESITFESVPVSDTRPSFLIPKVSSVSEDVPF